MTMGPAIIPMDYTNMGSNNALDRNAPTISRVLDTLITNNHGVINNSSTSKLTLSPDEDLQYAVKMSQSISM